MESYLSIITLNVNGLNAPTKRQRLIEWIQKQDPYICFYKRPTSKQGTIQTESEGLEKDILHRWRPKESRSSNTQIRYNRLWNKGCGRDKEGHYIKIKGSIQEDITIINIYAPNIGAPQYVRQMLTSMKGDINNNTITCICNTPMDISTKHKISKETLTLNHAMDQLDLIIYRTFHPKTMNFTFFLSAHRTFSRIDHILGHKPSLGKFKKLKSFQASFLIRM